MATTTTLRPSQAPSFGYRDIQGGEAAPPSDNENRGGQDRFRSSTGYGAVPWSYGNAGQQGGGGRAADTRVQTADWQGDFGSWAKTTAKGVASVLNPAYGAKVAYEYLKDDYQSRGNDGRDERGYTAENRAENAQRDQGRHGSAGEAGGGGRSTDGVGGGGFGSDADRTSSPGGMGGYKHGGPIVGPGDGNDDAVPINASNGEFVVQAQAAQALGPQFLQMLNDPQFAMALAEALREVMGAVGGQPPSMPPQAQPSMPPAPPQAGMGAGPLSRVY